MSSISAGTAAGTSLVQTGDTTGALVIKTGSSAATAATFNADQTTTLAQPLPIASGGTGATTLSGITVGNATNATLATTATTATNLAGGSNGTIPYQSAAGTTAMLAAGTSGQVLQSNGSSAPSWITPSSGAMTLITTTTASFSATVDFTGLTSTYRNYVVIVSNATPQTNNAALVLRTSTNNGSSYDAGASDYYSTGTNFGNSTWNYVAVLDDRAYINASGMVNNTTQGGTSFTLTLVNPSGATRTQWYATGVENGTSEVGAFTRGGYRVATTGAVNAIRFLYGSGNIASGTFKLYGIS